MERLKKLPIPGQRILRTMIAVWLCLLVYVLRGRQGEPLYAALAAEYGLVKTGGSDFHGDNKPHIQLGTGIENELDVPYAWLEKLKKAAGK